MDDINIIRYEVELKDGYYVFTPIIELNGVKMLASIKAFIIANTYRIHEKLYDSLWLEFTKSVFYSLESFKSEIEILKKEIDDIKKGGINWHNTSEN